MIEPVTCMLLLTKCSIYKVSRQLGIFLPWTSGKRNAPVDLFTLMDPFQTTGVPRTNSQDQNPPPRLEINDFIQNDMFFSLYVQALRE